MDDTEQDRAPDDPADGDDPRARWRTMPAPVTPEQWEAGHDTDPIPESLADAEGDRANREARWVIERAGGGGA